MQRQRYRRNTNRVFHSESLVCRTCHTEIIKDTPDCVIRIFNTSNANIIWYKVKANQTKNLNRINRDLFCVCGYFVGTVNNFRNLNYRYYLKQRCVTRAITIYSD